MPSGPPELHAYWCEKDQSVDTHGDRMCAGDRAAQKHLMDRGYTLTRKWTWVKPPNIEEPTEEDNRALNYLVWEWDFGGIEGEW